MALRKTTQICLAAAIVGFSVGVGSAWPRVAAYLYQQVYPSEPAEREALQLCILQDPGFNRLDAAQREGCYRHALLPSAAGPDSTQVNFIDLRRAASLGRMPQDDIRAQEQTAGFLHRPPVVFVAKK